jgi:hypothetical protein
VKKLVAIPFFVTINFTKLKITLFFECGRNWANFEFSKNYRTFYSKNCHQALKNMGLGFRDNLFRIPDPGVKKAPVPGSGSATLVK